MSGWSVRNLGLNPGEKCPSEAPRGDIELNFMTKLHFENLSPTTEHQFGKNAYASAGFEEITH